MVHPIRDRCRFPTLNFLTERVLQSDKCKANQNLDIQLYGSETESGSNAEINVFFYLLWPLLACVSEVQETGVCPMQQFMDTVISCIQN